MDLTLNYNDNPFATMFSYSYITPHGYICEYMQIGKTAL